MEGWREILKQEHDYKARKDWDPPPLLHPLFGRYEGRRERTPEDTAPAEVRLPVVVRSSLLGTVVATPETRRVSALTQRRFWVIWYQERT